MTLIQYLLHLGVDMYYKITEKISVSNLWFKMGISLENKCMNKGEIAQLCPTLCDPLDCNPPGSSIHAIFQARILEWVAIPISRGSFWPRDQTRVSRIAGRLFTIWATKIPYMGIWLENKCIEWPYVPCPDGLYFISFSFKNYGRSELEEILETNLTSFFIYRLENWSSK